MIDATLSVSLEKVAESPYQKPRVLISRCLLGEKVRYDGNDCHQPTLITQLSRAVDLIPICPEVEAGLGVPRPPVQLVKTQEKVTVLGTVQLDLDVSEVLIPWCEQAVVTLCADIHGAVLKARSPSCGVDSTPLHDSRRVVVEIGSGVFAAGLRKYHPSMPIVEESALQEQEKVQLFLNAVQGYFESNK